MPLLEDATETEVSETPAAKFAFEWAGFGDQFELLVDIPGHPKGSHVGANTLRRAGIAVPSKSEARAAMARVPITRGILATHGYANHIPGMTHAGMGERPGTPVFNESGRIIGSRALKVSDGLGE